MTSEWNDVTRLTSASSDPVELTRVLCDIPSVSGDEARITDAVEAVLREISSGDGPDLTIRRNGDTIVASTELGRPSRIVVAGHLDTVPIEDNLPTRDEVLDGHPVVWGRGTCDMKAGVAMQLHTAARLRAPAHDVTWVFYDHEEVDASLNGLGRVVRENPDWITGDLAILGEPSNAGLEGGCNGTIRVEVTASGVRAHSARAFKGVNAIHGAAEVLVRLREHEAPVVTVDGLEYRESLSAVGIRGGVAGNVIPDECVVTVNYRFAPDKTAAQAQAFLEDFFTGFPVRVTDAAGGARPGLDKPVTLAFAASVARGRGLTFAQDLPTPEELKEHGLVAAKLGWTDVSRFAELGIPAINFGPGDPTFAHKADEHVRVAEVESACRDLVAFLEPGA